MRSSVGLKDNGRGVCEGERRKRKGRGHEETAKPGRRKKEMGDKETKPYPLPKLLKDLVSIKNVLLNLFVRSHGRVGEEMRTMSL